MFAKLSRMTQGTLKIHSENILPIIKKWLYTDKDIFVRELVSNSSDAIQKLKLQDVDDAFQIKVSIDKEKRQLIFSDNGIGMNAEEVETYIAQIAFSGAEQFVEKYEQNHEMIGHFGLGFYSAYMVASCVEIESLSHAGGDPVHWTCDGGATYTIEKGQRTERGTNVILTIAEGEDDYLDPAHLRKILTHYCAFLPVPIFLEESQINPTAPLWMRSPADCTDEDYKAFYRQLYPFEPDPLFWVHLNVDYPFHLKGILYFPKLPEGGEWKRESIKLFCNRVFVSDNCQDLLPDYLMMLRGAIDSPDIPLNVSRSTLQLDKTVRQLGSHISKKVSDRLAALYRSEKKTFLSYWNDIEVIIKYGAVQDEKFYERVKEFLVWKTSKGEWVTAQDEGTHLYATEGSSALLSLYKEKEVLIVEPSMLNQAVIAQIERQSRVKFQRIDAEIDELLDPSREKSLLDAEGKSEAAKIADCFRKRLGLEKVEAKSFADDQLPGMLKIEEQERRLREMMRGAPVIKPTFVVNTNNPLVQTICKLDAAKPELAAEVAKAVYDLTRLSQKEMDAEGVPAFIEHHTRLLEKLAGLAL